MTATALVAATNSLTQSTADVAADSTQVIGNKTYTIKASYSNTDGHVTQGATAAETLANLKAAINLESGAGTKYAAAMTENDLVEAYAVSATVLSLKARVAGVTGNLIPLGTAPTNWTRGGALFTGGAGSPDANIDEILANCQINAEVIARLKPVNQSTGPTLMEAMAPAPVLTMEEITQQQAEDHKSKVDAVMAASRKVHEDFLAAQKEREEHDEEVRQAREEGQPEPEPIGSPSPDPNDAEPEGEPEDEEKPEIDPDDPDKDPTKAIPEKPKSRKARRVPPPRHSAKSRKAHG